jgi:hypothetical protein
VIETHEHVVYVASGANEARRGAGRPTHGAGDGPGSGGGVPDGGLRRKLTAMMVIPARKATFCDRRHTPGGANL